MAKRKSAPKPDASGRANQQFAVERAFFEGFEGWATRNGYDRKLVFLAAIRNFVELSHEERTALFEQAASWANEGWVFPDA